MNYKEAKTYLDSLTNYEILSSYSYQESFNLKRIIRFLKLLGNPQKSLKTIHIAGTKGKGSTASFIAHILKEADFQVGLYTSPHLIDLRERIRILDRANSLFDEFEGMISENELSKIVKTLKPKIETFNKKLEEAPLSFFEVFTALALVYFKEKKVDFVVLETGLGGRLDATNVVKPLVCAITPISIEHTQYLGSSLSEIAQEKAGIIKNKSMVISAPQRRPVEKVLRDKASKNNAKIYFLGKDITIEKEISNLEEQSFDLKSMHKEFKDLKIKLKGSFQIINAALSVAVIDALKNRKVFIKEETIKEGLLTAKWPCRFELVDSYPTVIIDGAQNTHSVGVLMDSIKKLFSDKKIILVLGISADKDIKGMCEIFRNSVDAVILTKAHHPRAASPVRIEQEGEFQGAKITKSVIEAIRLAKALAKKEDLILIAGSLFVAGEARQYLKMDMFYARIK